jgi:hypothetical protein
MQLLQFPPWSSLVTEQYLQICFWLLFCSLQILTGFNRSPDLVPLIGSSRY